MQREIIFSDLANNCLPKENISEKRLKGKWCSYSYETANFNGTMLVSTVESTPDDVVLTPKLLGWYKIFVGLYVPAYTSAVVDLKLSGDEAFMQLSPCLERTFGEHIVDDVFWRCSRMDGVSITIGKHLSIGHTTLATVAWFRFVPMTDSEIEQYKSDKRRTDTKRIYATDDMHNKLCLCDVSDISGWKSAVLNCVDSDVEWLAIESLSHNNGKVEDCEIENFAFARTIDRAFQTRWKKDYSYDTLKEVVECGKRYGIKMCVSLRIAEWGCEFPLDRICFEQKFAEENPHLRCIDRDGDITEYLSFVYPEVQEYIIGEFIKMAQTGCDAVQLLFSRGWPYVLFEQPFVDLFYEQYKEDARVLPLDDERIVKVKCGIMTSFMRRLRSTLDGKGFKSTELHAKVMFSMYDNVLVGLDLETWAKEGIIDRIISDERRVREILPQEIFNSEGKINLEKYTLYARSSTKPPILYEYDRIFAPMEDSMGMMRGPASQKERIAELMMLETKYGITVYIEIMPRVMSVEKIKEKALEIYNAGCGHIGLWDTYSRNIRKCEWTMWRRIGHREELADFATGSEEWFRPVRLIKIGGKNVRNYKPIWGA